MFTPQAKLPEAWKPEPRLRQKKVSLGRIFHASGREPWESHACTGFNPTKVLPEAWGVKMPQAESRICFLKKLWIQAKMFVGFILQQQLPESLNFAWGVKTPLAMLDRICFWTQFFRTLDFAWGVFTPPESRLRQHIGSFDPCWLRVWMITKKLWIV